MKPEILGLWLKKQPSTRRRIVMADFVLLAAMAKAPEIQGTKNSNC